MSEAVSRDRFVESIQQAFDACWNPPPQPFRSASFEFPSAEEERLEPELRLVARADLVLPFAAAGLLDEREPVGNLGAPADIRREVRKQGLPDLYLSVGCQLARGTRDADPFLGDELTQEWSTWLTYCMRAHSPELRRTLPFLVDARDAIAGVQHAPRRRIERIGPDGERLTSLVPRRAEDPVEAARVDLLLDQCEIVAAHADSFRILGPLFPHVLATVWGDNPRQPSDDGEVAFPFIPYFWPFSEESLRAVAAICDSIERLAQSLDVDEEDEDRERQAGAYVR